MAEAPRILVYYTSREDSWFWLATESYGLIGMFSSLLEKLFRDKYVHVYDWSRAIILKKYTLLPQ